MTAENLAVKDRFLGAVFAGDFAALLDLIHPDFAMRQVDALPYGGLYEGPEGFVSFIQKFLAMLDIEQLEATETFVSETGGIVMELAVRTTLKQTGARMDTTMLEKWEFADGKVIRISPHYFDPTFR